MINYIKVIIKYPSEIKIGDYIFFSDNIITEVISIEKGTRHSRENGYPYHFTGKYNDIIYKKTYYSNVIKYIKIKNISDKILDANIDITPTENI